MLEIRMCTCARELPRVPSSTTNSLLICNCACPEKTSSCQNSPDSTKSFAVTDAALPLSNPPHGTFRSHHWAAMELLLLFMPMIMAGCFPTHPPASSDTGTCSVCPKASMIYTDFGFVCANTFCNSCSSYFNAHVLSAHDALRQTQQRLEPVLVPAAHRHEVVLCDAETAQQLRVVQRTASRPRPCTAAGMYMSAKQQRRLERLHPDAMCMSPECLPNHVLLDVGDFVEHLGSRHDGALCARLSTVLM